jgi:hypothetical protein
MAVVVGCSVRARMHCFRSCVCTERAATGWAPKKAAVTLVGAGSSRQAARTGTDENDIGTWNQTCPGMVTGNRECTICTRIRAEHFFYSRHKQCQACQKAVNAVAGQLGRDRRNVLPIYREVIRRLSVHEIQNLDTGRHLVHDAVASQLAAGLPAPCESTLATGKSQEQEEEEIAGTRGRGARRNKRKRSCDQVGPNDAEPAAKKPCAADATAAPPATDSAAQLQGHEVDRECGLWLLASVCEQAWADLHSLA